MVTGLEQFKNHFLPYQDHYVIIGGVACFLLMNEVGLNFRATKDFDLVLLIEAIDNNFIRSFWDFIKKGNYHNCQQSTGKKLFYRFDKPEKKDFPSMIELFSKIPDVIKLKGFGHVTPIPAEEELSSLSAILLDENYYHFILSGKRKIEGITLLDAQHIIPLKARAWLDLSKRKKDGESIDDKNIRKHQNDIFRLYQLLTDDYHVEIPETIKQDMIQFLSQVKNTSIDLKSLGLKNTSLQEIFDNLDKLYCR